MVKHQDADRFQADYQLVFENANEGIFVHDCESGAILMVNEKVVEMTGYTKAELCRLTVGDISGRSPAYSAAQAVRKIHAAVAQGPQIFEWVFCDPEGKEFPVEVNLKHIEINGRPRILALVRDITKRKAAENELIKREAYYRKLIENSADGIAILAPDGAIRYLGASTGKVLGYREQDGAGANFFDWMDPADIRRVKPRFKTLERDDETVHTLQFRLRHKDGSWRTHECSCKNLQHDPSINGILLNFRDITERLAAEERAKQRERELHHLTRLSTMGEMASAIAHELNQPFAAVVNYLGGSIQRLKSDNADPAQLLKVMEAAQTQAEYAGKIIHSLRGFLRRSTYQRAPADLNQLVEGVSAFIKIRADDTRATVAYELASPSPRVICDHVLVEQVILNLALNGIEAMAENPPERRRLTIASGRSGRGAARLTITDQGPGLPSTDPEVLFNAFYTTKKDGLGIGLSLCRSIIDSHDGRLWCDEAAGGGAAFHFTLPAAEAS